MLCDWVQFNLKESQNFEAVTSNFRDLLALCSVDNCPQIELNLNRYADENIRKKMEEYETNQEILMKRLTEKENTLAKNW